MTTPSEDRTDLGPIELTRRKGDEAFHDGGRLLNFALLNFWQWSASDLVSNATRGVLAEYLVAQALGIGIDGVREEWAAYDLTAPDGTRLEVKSAAYIQSWHQDRLSRVSFRVPKTRTWSRDDNKVSEGMERQADVYVFALLANTDQGSLDPMDVSQWEFFVVPTATLDSRKRSQHSITLPSLKALTGKPVCFSMLRKAIEEAGKAQRELSESAKPSDGSPGCS